MTFSVPVPLASRFLRQVRPRDRSKFLAEALGQRLDEDEKRIIEACLNANDDLHIKEVESEFDAMRDPVEEPWDAPEKR